MLTVAFIFAIIAILSAVMMLVSAFRLPDSYVLFFYCTTAITGVTAIILVVIAVY